MEMEVDPGPASSVNALGHTRRWRRRRLDAGDDMVAAAERGVLAVTTVVGRGSRGQGQLAGDGRGAGLAVAAEVVLALAPDEAVEPHHYDHRANHAVTTSAGKKKEL